MRPETSALFEGEDEEEQCSSSWTTSSIGKDSDLSSSEDTECGDLNNENEAQSQSPYKYNDVAPLDMMDSYSVQPIRRGISKFYDGKSKSFTSLADIAVSSTSVKDIAKPENAYTRRRRNLMAFNHVWEKNRRNFSLGSNSGGISKSPISSSQSVVALAFGINYEIESSSSCTSEESTPRSTTPLPPLFPRKRVSSESSGPSSPIQQNFSNWRSCSLADLQQCTTVATINMPTSSGGNKSVNLSHCSTMLNFFD